MTSRKLILLGGLTVGVIDITDAFIFFGLRGASPIVILQSIASGLLGKSAFQGGIPVAALGLFLHFLIATTIVTLFTLASRPMPGLTRHPVTLGGLYGIVVYCVMNYVVIPLSAMHQGVDHFPVVLNGILIHIFGIGIVSALFARAANRQLEQWHGSAHS